MRVVIPNYIYTMIKISSLKTLNITQEQYRDLQQIKDEHELLKNIEDFFPGISKTKDVTIIGIEKALFSIYFKIFEKVLISSPTQMQIFLLSLLNRYEIWNIKTYIVGMLANLSLEEIQEEILFDPERIMHRSEFIKTLLKKSKLQDGIKYLKKSKYAKAIDRGMYFYNKRNEVFLLEALLDKFYFTELVNSASYFGGLEKKLFSSYVDILIQKYNLILVYRSVRNRISKDLLKQLIIPQGNIITPGLLQVLSAVTEREEFFHVISGFARKNSTLRLIGKKLTIENPIIPILSALNQTLLSSLDLTGTDNFEALTVDQILALIFNKENEIYKVLSLFIKIIHKINE